MLVHLTTRNTAMQDAFIYDGLRTPVGRHAGGLAPVRPDDLLAGVITAVVARSKFKPEQFGDAIIGCTKPAGEGARNPPPPAPLPRGPPTTDRGAPPSQKKCAQARADGFFDGETGPVTIGGRKGAETVIAQDEPPRPNTTYERLAELKPLFAGGVVTAGNASGINDGAAALVIGTEAVGEKAGAKPMARFVSAAVAGVEPRVMGLGPVPATQN